MDIVQTLPTPKMPIKRARKLVRFALRVCGMKFVDAREIHPPSEPQDSESDATAGKTGD